MMLPAILAASALAFDAGADLRIRQEIMDNVPGLPGGGNLSRAVAGKGKNQMRFRPRVWGDLKAWENFRLYARLADEFRWNVHPKNHSSAFPDELILDNLFVDGTGLFDGVFDFRIGRQDIYNLYGLDHVFVDGTPGDGSRTVYSDVVRFGFAFDEEDRLDVFALHNDDFGGIRWGTRGSRRHISSRYAASDVDYDEWGGGAVWSAKAFGLDYKIFAASKKTEHDGDTEVAGLKLLPKFTEELSGDFEAMAEDDGEWSAYAAVNWKDSGEGAIKPFAGAGVHFLSEDWDPMWSRGVNYSEVFLYGSHDGVAWWSNMIYLQLSGGLDLGRHHRIGASTGPMFAANNDGLGGGDGEFKGLLSQARYDFPLLTAGEDGRFEIFGHVYAELFNPGDYYASDRPAWFLRWQVEFRF
ncbi:MAG: hypothetical protein ILO34_02960 [Kiritimatiellae bacterium]|nr:hypothetical protein [Kiritimatiellia bacterium]